MRFAHFFIDRPVFAAVLSLVLLLIGSVAAFTLPVSMYPEIAPPTVVVNARYPGASAAVVSETVAVPIETQINGVERMLYMQSQASSDGSLQISIAFELGTDLNVAAVQVQNRVELAAPQLPEEVRRQGVTVRKNSPDLLMTVQIFSPTGAYDRLYLSNFATLQVRDQLARVDGVGDIRVFGGRDYAMRLWLDPQRLTARNMTVGDVLEAVRDQNLQVSAGVVGQQPQPAGAAEFQYTVNAEGRLSSAEQFGAIVVKRGAEGQVTLVRDVGRVELGAADMNVASTYNNQPSIGMGVFQLPGSNSIQTANAVRARMAELAQDFPKGVQYAIPLDTTVFVRTSINDVLITLLEATGLVVIVVVLFLQSWRTAIVPLLAIPVSLIGTFAFMSVLGFSLNNLSLFGMVLAIGIVVDDAIVVVENVERWIDDGHSPRDATYHAMTEVTPAVIAIAFGLSAVFIPVAFLSGITGQFYRQFALTISISTLLSAFNSLTLSPALCALLLRPKGARPDLFTRIVNFLLGWLFGLFNRLMSASTRAYAAATRRIVRLSLIALLLYGGLLIVGVLGFRAVPRGFIPPQDMGYLLVNVTLQDAAALDRTDDALQKLMAIARAEPGVREANGMTGVSFISGGNRSNGATMFLILDEFSKRSHDPALSSTGIAQTLTRKFADVQDAIATVVPPPPIRGVGTAGGFKMQVQDCTGSGDPLTLQQVTNELLAAARQRPELQSMQTSFRAAVPQLKVEVDRLRVQQQGVELSDVYEALSVLLGSQYINDFTFLGRAYRVIAAAEARFRATAEGLGQFPTRNNDGEIVPLAALVNVRHISAPDRILRFNLFPAADVQGTAAPGVSSGDAMAIMEELAAQTLPPGYGFEWTEMALQEKLAGNTAFLIFPLCVLFVWLVHSAEYESFSLSTAIILIVPMCLVAGITGVWLSGRDNNIFTQIGFLVLAGLSAKNAVLIVEFAKQQEEKGRHYVDAVVEAARLRLRPILMTSVAFILGVLPLLLASGAGAEMRQALGTVVFWGMIGVTFFGLILTPVFYVTIRWIGTKLGVKPPHHLPPPVASIAPRQHQ